MPIQFFTETPSDTVVRATLTVDHEGDLTLRLNNIRVLYLDNVGGAISRFEIMPDDAQRLHDAGFDIENGLLGFDG